MLSFRNGAGHSFRLEVVRYQYPDAEQLALSYLDMNWLLVRIIARDSVGEWSAQDPCMTTRELADLAGWLESLSRGMKQHNHCAFREPCICFALRGMTSADAAVAVQVDYDLRPPWRPRINPRQQAVTLDFRLAREEACVAASSVRGMVARFPERTETWFDTRKG